MNILALDPAMKCGWAYVGPKQNVLSGVQPFEAPTFRFRCKHYRDWLLEIVRRLDVDLIAIEAMYKTSFGSNEKTEKWLRAVNILAHEVAATRNIDIEEIAINAWRASFIGVTTAPKRIGADLPKAKRSNLSRQWLKNRVMMQCRDMGFRPHDDNEADALGILEYVRRKHDREYGSTSETMFSRREADE